MPEAGDGEQLGDPWSRPMTIACPHESGPSRCAPLLPFRLSGRVWPERRGCRWPSEFCPSAANRMANSTNASVAKRDRVSRPDALFSRRSGRPARGIRGHA